MENNNTNPLVGQLLDGFISRLVDALTETVIAKLDERLLRVEQVALDTARKLDDGGSVIVQLNAQAKVLERFDTRLDKVETINAQAMSKAEVSAEVDRALDAREIVTRGDVEDVVNEQLPDFDDLVNERLPDMDDYLQTSDLESELENVTVPVDEDTVREAVKAALDEILPSLRVKRD